MKTYTGTSGPHMTYAYIHTHVCARTGAGSEYYGVTDRVLHIDASEIGGVLHSGGSTDGALHTGASTTTTTSRAVRVLHTSAEQTCLSGRVRPLGQRPDTDRTSSQ